MTTPPARRREPPPLRLVRIYEEDRSIMLRGLEQVLAWPVECLEAEAAAADSFSDEAEEYART
jgi:hypothetical protein